MEKDLLSSIIHLLFFFLQNYVELLGWYNGITELKALRGERVKYSGFSLPMFPDNLGTVPCYTLW